MSFDPSEFIHGLEAAHQRVRDALEQAVDELAEAILNKAQEYCPVDTGFLRRSGEATKAVWEGDTLTAEIGFSAVSKNTAGEEFNYAVKVHEDLNIVIHTSKNTKARSKYLETAMREMIPHFSKRAAELVREALG